jgi:hypothetical protein
MSCRQHCYDDGDEEPDYEFDESGFNQNQHMAENIDDVYPPQGVEATVPWFQKTVTESWLFEVNGRNKGRNWSLCKFFKQFDTIKDLSHHYYANKLV